MANISQTNDPNRLEKGWSVAEPLLARAGLCREESASGAPRGVPTVVIPSEQIARERRWARGHRRDAVAERREPEAPARQSL